MRTFDFTSYLFVLQNITLNYILPLLGKSSTIGTHKLPLCFLKDATYEKWFEVFNAWELGKLVGEDGKRPTNIPKSHRLDITMNNVNETIGLRDSELLFLAEAILKNEVSVKSNKITSH